MQSTGQTSTQALSLTSMHGSTITYAIGFLPCTEQVRRPLGIYGLALLTLPLDRRAEPGSVHGGDHLLDRHLSRIEHDTRLLVAEAHVRPRHALEPFQGPLDRQRSRPSRH